MRWRSSRVKKKAELSDANKGGGSSSGALASIGAQAKLEVRPPDDEFEREADAVADRVMTGPEVSPSGSADVELSPEQVGAAPPPVNADKAMPPVMPASKVEGVVGSNQQKIDKQLGDLGLQDPMATFAKSGDSKMEAVVASKAAFDEDAQKSGAEFRDGEAGTRESTQEAAGTLGKEKLGAMMASRQGQIGQVAASQKAGQQRSELTRADAIQQANDIFTRTEGKVKPRLEKLKEVALQRFNQATTNAVNFYANGIKAAEERWKNLNIIDKAAEQTAQFLFGLPRSLEIAIQGLDKGFEEDMSRAVKSIASLIKVNLDQAKKDIQAGEREFQALMERLPKNLSDLKAELSEDFAKKFGALKTAVSDTRQALVEGVANAYRKALEDVKNARQAVLDRNKTLGQQLQDGIAALGDLLLGGLRKLQQAFSDGVETLLRVLDDPVTFARNFLRGIAAGIQSFAANILTHLKNGLFQWLTGAAGSAGIQLPETFDAKGVLSLVLQVLGLTVDNIKSRARKIWGDKVVDAIEKGVAGAEKALELFQILQTEGVAGLFNFLKSKFIEMKDKAIASIQNAIAFELVKAAIKKILTLLVPGGAFLQAILSVVDAVFFFMRNAAKFAELINTITSAVSDILAGNIGALASKVEGVLARGIPIVLDFLASMIGFGSKIVEVIQKALDAIRAPIQKAIDALLMAIKNALAGFIAKLKGAFKGKKGKGDQKELTPTAAIAAAKEELGQPTKAEEPQQAIAEKDQQARSLEQEIQPRLKKGQRIRIVVDKSTAGIDKDGDIDIQISINPKGTAQPTVGQSFVKRFGRYISASHPDARELVRRGVGAIPKSKSNIQKWDTVKQELANVSPTKGLLQTPLGPTPYGENRSAILATALTAVNGSSPDAGELGKAKRQVNTASGFFATPAEKVRVGIFNARASDGALQSSFETAIKESAKDGPTEKYDRLKHYGKTPTTSDRNYFLNQGLVSQRLINVGWVLDHEPPLVVRYYKGGAGEKPGFKMTQAERFASGRRRDLMTPQERALSDAQGGTLKKASQDLAKKAGL